MSWPKFPKKLHVSKRIWTVRENERPERPTLDPPSKGTLFDIKIQIISVHFSDKSCTFLKSILFYYRVPE